MNNGLAGLEETFRGCGLTFRCFPGVRCECLAFQAGRIERQHRVVPEKIATGGRQIELTVEVFRLIACAATPDELVKRLSSVAPRESYRELLE